MSLQQDLMDVEKGFWTGGPQAYEENADEECLVVFSEMAKVMARDEIAKTAKKGRWKDVAMTVKGLSRLSEDSAVIAYECTAKREDGAPYHALVSSGYVKRGGGWKLAFHQQTPLQ